MNPYALIGPSQRLLAAARAAGVPASAGREAVFQWARESGWLKRG